VPETPRRRRFQIHLSTAILMMFVAGVLIWANVRGQKEFEPRESKSAFFTNMGEAVFTKVRLALLLLTGWSRFQFSSPSGSAANG